MGTWSTQTVDAARACLKKEVSEPGIIYSERMTKVNDWIPSQKSSGVIRRVGWGEAVRDIILVMSSS